MEREFRITENAVKNLLYDYAKHRAMYKFIELKSDPEDLYDDAEYTYHKACCNTAETWMRTLGISPESNFVMEFVERER